MKSRKQETSKTRRPGVKSDRFLEEESREQEVAKKGLNLEDIYDEEELANEFLTQKDQMIINTDIPERIQIKYSKK